MDCPLKEPRIWDWALGMAQHVAKLSKDPSTKVGAVIFDSRRRIISAGYNGLPRGVEDQPRRLHNRDLKLKMTLHAEKNAVSFATGNLEGSTIMVTHPCCTQCAALLIQNGVAHVCWPAPTNEFRDRWGPDLIIAEEMLNEAGVQIHER